ncbi:nuclear autoantigenic sperm protein isoform X4 [Ixodes scapularis]|uniref:nuclear autoantigenic sperm protein isoform X4 n=1 Tax=Ixodes scapularis TaxID=6945 RepID=UPI001AD62BDD|nr:nuclear autoantigenic sperm protein isoform X4 [Ixodes scapularis]
MAEPASPPKPTSDAAPEGGKEAPVDAAMLLLQGKRHLLVQDFPSAVASLQEACQLLGVLYGETAPQCGEAYLCYGKALLELARQETGVLGNALDSEEEEEEEDDEEAEEGEGEGSGGEAAEGEGPAEAEKEEDAEEDLEKPEPALKEDIEPSEPCQPGTSSGTSAPAPKEEEEEVSNLQLAWEVLELAKIIFEGQAKKGSREAQLKVADVLLKLGEISLESDNCGQAVEDLGKCLCIQQELLDADSRQLAETHYQRGLAHSFAGHYHEAADDFRAALGALELRVDNLTKLIEEGKGKERTGSLDDDPIWRAEREVEDLKGLLPEVRAKMEDTQDMLRQDCKALKDATIQKMMDRVPPASPVKNAASGSEASRPVNVITHLIKRKETSATEKTTASPLKSAAAS